VAAKRVALVLAGAVAKGAFTAGVIHRLVRSKVEIVRIIAASSGSLNAALLASGIHAREISRAADQLVEVWTDRAEWNQFFHVSFGDLLRGEGISDQKRVLSLLREYIKPHTGPGDGAPIDLRLVVAPLHGAAGKIGSQPATTFEHVLEFSGEAFDSAETLEAVFSAATASAALPVVFSPVDIATDQLGPCIDGGTVNNTPIKWALEGSIGHSVDAIVVVTTTPETLPPVPESQPIAGAHLVSRVAELLINERVYRDLREATHVNEQLHALAALRGTHGDAAIDDVLAALAWQERREVEIVTIRPSESLSGTAFSGFFDRALRERYIALGQSDADQTLNAASLPVSG
jgi:NTE family protein